tara:strand:+ start:3763 stop:5043 length:1281 start_codon:yes stop_codon:yes gene_type:complete
MEIHEERIRFLNDKQAKPEGQYVLYWMQQSQRAEWNQALEYAVQQSAEMDLGVLVVFGLMEDYPEVSLRHYAFMMEGLQEVASQLSERKIKFVLEKGSPEKVAVKYTKDAALVVCDRGYLRHQKQWRKHVAEKSPVKVVQLECDLVVPVETVSDKEKYAARTIRSKIHEHWKNFRQKVSIQKPGKRSLSLSFKGEDMDKATEWLADMNIAQTPGPVTGHFKGGTSEAKKRFRSWLENSYSRYDENRSQPHRDDVSFMSPYLHFGQISPLWILEQLKGRRGNNREAYEEELIVRRELAVNFVHYNADYDSFKCIQGWALETLEKHKSDERPKVFTKDQLENAETDDVYWNAAMRTMKETGYLHNHMRMYWGKQILLYTNTPQYAYKVALELNNKYFLDGRDCNSFANIVWLFGKHDRAWAERAIWGK